MGKQFAVYHTSKGKGPGAGLGNHIDRAKGKEHTYQNADPKLRGLNIDFTSPAYKNLTIPQGIEKRIKEGYNGKRKIRNDAVKYLTHVFSGTHEQMTKIAKNEKALKYWLQKNAEFVKQEFGEGNTIRACLHLDEKTPHLHIVTVPITEDGRLSAKEIMGNKKQMQERQDRYAELMRPLGLERGIKNTGIKHETAQEYARRVKQADLELSNLKAFKSDKSIDIDNTFKNMNKSLKMAKIELLDPQREKKQERDRRAGFKR